MKNKSCFSKIIYYKKYKDLVDVKSFVFWGTIFSSTVIMIIYWIMKHYLSLNQVISKFVEYLDNITMSMIGFLGFIVTGLAILTGAISSKLFKSLKESKKLEALERILLSFYLLGIVSVIVIILGFIVHFIILIPISAINWVIPITLFVLCYLISFSILYAVKLIGDCLELFFIINSIEILLDDNKENDAVELKDKYNNFRIMALETIVLTNNGIECIDAYCNTIKNLIESDSNLPSDEKTSLLNMHEKHFYK